MFKKDMWHMSIKISFDDFNFERLVQAVRYDAYDRITKINIGLNLHGNKRYQSSEHVGQPSNFGNPFDYSLSL